jgi:lipoate-protein ligase A
MIWRNEPSVIIGKHQNTNREINHSFAESRDLPVIRRITGGGTVYQDMGNINFSFIYIDRIENMVDFRHFTKPVIHFLQGLGLNAAFEGKSNICADGLKVSGNSAHILKNKVLHHGTLLFNTDLDALEKAVDGREECYKDKSVRSVRSKVTNISNLLSLKISEEEFINLFQKFIFNYFSGSFMNELNPIEKKSISKLVEEKYKNINWNYGYSPEYMFVEEWKTLEGDFSVSLNVKNGLIINAEITGPENNSSFLKTVKDELTGRFHERKSISERLKKINFASENEVCLMNEIILHLF